MQKIFISYSHDSPEHARAVLKLANRLVEDGVDCILDQYEDTPVEGWPKWMDKHIKDAEFVIMICTETYFRRVMGTEEEGKGLGVRWEGNLIYNAIYQAGSDNSRFIPALFLPGNAEHIPPPLQGTSYYLLDSEDNYEKLYKRITRQGKVKKPKLGQKKGFPDIEEKPLHFDKTQVDEATMPMPDENLVIKTPAPLKAFSLDENIEAPLFPFDLGTVWGLERGTFIGIAAGRENDGLYESLIRAEGILYNVDQASANPGIFPIRWWIRVDFTIYPNGPVHESQIWGAGRKTEDTSKVRWLDARGLVEGLVPGFFFELPYDSIDTYLPSLNSWCDFVNNTFSSRYPAIIVHITGLSENNCTNVIQKIAGSLCDVTGISPQKMQLVNAFVPEVMTKERTINKDTSLSPRNILKRNPKLPALHFFNCVYHAMQTKKGGEELVPFEKGQKGFPLVYDTLDRYWEDCSTYLGNETPEIDAEEIVMDISKNLSDQDARFHGEFLQLVETYLPGHLPDIVRAYAGIKSTESRMEALFFALKNDSLVDAWIEGSGIEEDQIPRPEDFDGVPQTNQGTALSRYVLGLLRALRNKNVSQRAREVLLNISKEMAGPIARICYFCLEITDEEQSKTDWGANECFYALQAGIEDRLLKKWLKLLEIDQMHVWWGLAALSPGKELFSVLHDLEAEKRAVFGLCTAGELQKVLSDPYIELKIMECRRYRPINRTSSQGGNSSND